MSFTNANEKIYSAKSRAQLAIFFLMGCIILDGVAIISDFSELSLLQEAFYGGKVSEMEVDANDSNQAVIGLVQLTLFIITGVFFLRWLYRAYDNLTVLGVKDRKYTPGWAVGYYFIPGINIVRPFQIMRELWNSSEPGEKGTFLQSMTTYQSTPAIIKLWWATWLISSILGQIAMRLSIRGTTAEHLYFSSIFQIACDISSIITTIYAILVIKGIGERQEERWRWLNNFVPAPNKNRTPFV